MITTFFIGLFAVLLAYLNGKGLLKHGLEMSFVLLTVFLAIRYDWGNDYPGYLAMFKDYNNMNLGLFDLSSLRNISRNNEYGWTFLNVLFKPFGFFAMVIVITIFEQFILYRFIKKYVPVKLYWLSVFLYVFGASYMLIGSSMMRQYLAMTFYLIAIDFIYSKKFIPFVLIILLASTIHSSVLVTLPTYLFCYINVKFSKRTIFILCFLSVVWFFLATIIFKELFLNLISLDVFKGYERYSNNPGEYEYTIGVYVRFIIFFISLFNLHKLSPRIRLFALLNFINFLLFPLFSFSILVSRIACYFGLLSVVIYPCLVQSIKRTDYKWFLIIVLLLINIKGFYSFFFQDVWHDSFFVYKSIFSAQFVFP